MKSKQIHVRCLVGLGALLIAGCSTMNETKERELNRMADNALAKIVFEQPGLQGELGRAVGYMGFEWSSSEVPMVGKRGAGVLVDQASGERTVIRISALEIKGAQGIGDYIGVMLMNDVETFQLAKTEGLSLENQGTIYIYVKGEDSAVYPVKHMSFEPKSR